MLNRAETELLFAMHEPEAEQGQQFINTRLSQIIRYQGLEMIHPSTVANHQKIAQTMALEAVGWFENMGPPFIYEKPTVLLRLAGNHDNHEADQTLGDIPASSKEAMTDEERTALKEREYQIHRNQAVDVYSLEPESDSYLQYVKEKQDLEELSTPEAEYTKAGDTLHAIWEVLHECVAGNEAFYPVLERYAERSMRLAQRSKIWDRLRFHRNIQLDPDHFPTPESLQGMPLITREQVLSVNAESADGWDTFMETMNNPEYPVWYRTGFDQILRTFGVSDAARVLFPRWRRSFYPDVEYLLSQGSVHEPDTY